MAAATVDLERLAKVPVATLTQVMQGMGRPRAFMEGIVPLDADAKIAGRARTLRFLPARVPAEEAARPLPGIPQRRVIESIAKDEVLVIDAGGETSGGLIGDILSTRVQHRGGVGGDYRRSGARYDPDPRGGAADLDARRARRDRLPGAVRRRLR
ncbi:MAG: hypothetical protein QF719_02855 [Chloroflexota bacterium]|nr:hypothetical protein [Chloroflexota bacterium]MDP6757141.1 hypothetical protein [Chloroflexota bacterium]